MAKTRDQLLQYTLEHVEFGDDIDVIEKDADIVEYLLDNCEITVPEENTFFVNVNCDGIIHPSIWRRAGKFNDVISECGLDAGNENLAYTGLYDFSHTCPMWEDIVELGIYGLKMRVAEHLKRCPSDAKKERFYTQTIRVYDAALKFMRRASDMAKACGKTEMADNLIYLITHSPNNLYRAMQTMIIFYFLQHMFEGTNVRTLGRLDSLFFDLYKKEDSEHAKELIDSFIAEIDTLEAPSNIPFAICGSDENGRQCINELSYILLDSYQRVPTVNTKLHILCSDETPKDIIRIAFDGIRNGHNSIVFMSDKKVIEALEKLGEAHEDVVKYHIVGCYECGGQQEITSSCNARVSIPKAVEYAMNSGIDMMSGDAVGLENDGAFENFEDFYSEVLRQLDNLCDKAIEMTDIYEERYKYIHSSLFFSSTYPIALENGGDIYCDYSAKYNNSSLNALGIGTAVDSLYAIKRLVFDEKKLSLSTLSDILKDNWKDNELLRLMIKNKYPKFGQCNAEIDSFAKNIVEHISKTVNGRPNKKGGIYRLGTFSINWRWEFGKKMAASADGRLAGETISQNTSAAFGADKKGATEHLLSVAAIDSVHTPNASVADIDLHLSSVKGENGLTALESTLMTYFSLGGFCVHYNVLDVDVLEKARENPDMYPNLQVRLCGWNVLFSSLSDEEKAEFIERSKVV